MKPLGSLMVFGVGLLQAAGSATEANLIEQANAAYAGHQPARAVELYRSYLSKFRDRADVRVYLGAALLSLSKTEAALAEVRQALALQPDYAKAYALAGRIYASAGEWVLADDFFDEALRRAPGDAESWYFRGRAAYDGSRFAAAIVAFEKAAALGYAPARVYENLALSLEAAGEAGSADAAFRKATACQSSDHPMIAYGGFLFRQGRTAECIRVLAALEKRGSKDSGLVFTLARAYYVSGELEQAVRLIEAHRQHADCRMIGLLARIQAVRGRSAEADKHLHGLEECQADASRQSK